MKEMPSKRGSIHQKFGFETCFDRDLYQGWLRRPHSLLLQSLAMPTQLPTLRGLP